MRILSWNVNGILSTVKNKTLAPLVARDPDVICVQEVRTKKEPSIFPDYHPTWNHAERDGFWGTLTLSKEKPLYVRRSCGVSELDGEGRIIICEFSELYIVNVYVPNPTGSLRRRDLRRMWDGALADIAQKLAWEKPTVICGDFNAVRTDDDFFSASVHQGEAQREAFAQDVRAGIETILDLGYVDGFRALHPDATNAFTWWAQRKSRRDVNRGWRFDYFFVSEDLANSIVSCEHLSSIRGSDHCPIELVIEP